MSKKLFQLISLVLIAVFVLAACAPAATPTPTTAPAATSAPAATKAPDATKAPEATKAPAATAAPTAVPATAAPKTVKMKIWHQWDGAYLTAITAAFKDYEKAHPGVTIDLSKPEDVKSALSVAIPAGEGPDIIAWANDAIGEQALKGNIVALNDYKIDDAFLKSIYTPAGIAGVTYKGKIWGLPETMEGIALVTNKAVWNDKYAPKDINDWDGLLKAAEQFQKDNPGKTLFCNQGFPGGDAYHIAPVFFGFGVPQYVDENGKAYADSPEALKAAEWLVSVSKFLQKEQTDDICRAALKEGKVAAQWTGPWAIKGFEDAKIDYSIVPMGKPFVGIKTMMLSKNAVDRKNQDVALDIMKYYTSADVQKKLALTNKTIPAQTAALADAEVAKLTAVAGFGKALSVGIPMNPSPFSSAQWDPIGNAVKTIWTGAKKPADAMATAQKQILDAVSQMK
jgi:arabinogalactan oligomer/maltooligosaccharide transport system substrate-binding protein